MTFRTYFEAKENDMELIKSAIEKVEDRPFKDLFGDKDRFLVKVYNPDFTKNLKDLELDRDKIDFVKRTYDGVPLGPMFRKMIENKRSKKPKMRELFRQAMRDSPYTYKGIMSDLEDAPVIIQEPEIIPGITPIHNKQIQNITQSRYGKERVVAFIKKGFWEPGPLSTSPEELIYKLFRSNGDEIEPRLNSLNDFMHLARVTKGEFGEKDPASKVKQCIDQNNVFFYLLFSRHPIDVLRMSDHKGVSSCHHLDGGMYKHCAIADAQNDGGIIYLIKGSDGQRAKLRLEEKEIFEDVNRKVDGLRPLGRTRLRRFIDLRTGEDFAVLARLSGQFGTFDQDLWDTAHAYVRKNQAIYNNPPEADYATTNIVMVGGTYTDNISPSGMLNKFFGKEIYDGVKIRDVDHDTPEDGNWVDELMDINDRFANNFRVYNVTLGWVIRREEIEVNLFFRTFVPFTKISEIVGPSEQSGFDSVSPDLGHLRKYIGDNAETITDYFWTEFELDNVQITTGTYPQGVIIDTHYQSIVNDPHDIDTLCEGVDQELHNKDSFVDELFANWKNPTAAG